MVVYVLVPGAVIVIALAVTGRLLTPGESYTQHIPLHVIAARAWDAGELPTWNPYSFSGYPLLGVSHGGVLYPLAGLFVFLPTALAANTYVLSSYAIAGVGTYLLARTLVNDRVGAGVAAISFAFCGPLVGHLGHPSMVASAAWLPWMLFGFERWRRDRTATSFVLSSAAVAMAALAGHAQIFFADVLVLALYALGTSITATRGQRVRTVAGATAVGVSGIALAAVQLVPTFAILEHTDRASISYETATSYAYSPSHGPLLVFPYLFGGPTDGWYGGPYGGQWYFASLAGYAGAAVLVLAGAGCIGLWRSRRFVVLAAIALLMLTFAFGASTPLARAFFALPVYGSFRAWGRYIFVVDLVVGLLAARGVAALRSDTARRDRAIRAAAIVFVGIVALAGVVLVARSLRTYMPEGRANPLAIGLPIAFGAGALVWARRASASRWSGRTLVALALADLIVSFVWSSGWNNSHDVARLRADMAGTRPLAWGPVIDESGGVDRLLTVGADVYTTPPDLGGVRGERSVIGGDPFAPREYIRALGMTQGGWIPSGERFWPDTSYLLDVLRVTTVAVRPTHQHLTDIAPAVASGRLWRLYPHSTRSEPTLVRFGYRPRLDDAFLVGRTQVASRQQALNHLARVDEVDPAEVAFVEDACRRCPTGPPGPAGFVLHTSRTPSTITVRVRTTRPAFLVVSESWFPGWTATVDGAPADVVRANGLVLGVAVPAGIRDVRLVYRAPGLRAGASLTALATVSLAGWGLARARRRRTRPRQ